MRTIITSLIFILCLQNISFATLEDINNHWAYNNIMRFYNNEYINGYQDNSFKPDEKIRYNEFIKILTKIIDNYILENSEMWDKAYIDYAKRIGLISDNIENYNEYIRRGEVVDILYNFLLYYEVIEDKTITKSQFFVNNNMLYGYSDGTLRLENYITRAEAIVLIERAIDFKDECIYNQNNTLDVFKYDNISSLTNYVGENNNFLNTYKFKNNKIYYSDLGRYSFYNDILVQKYNDIVINVLLDLLNKDAYVLNTYLDSNKSIIIAYGLKDTFVSNGSTLFEIYLFEDKQKYQEYEYDMKVSVHKLWKELAEIKSGIKYNKYYIGKLKKSLLHFLSNSDVEYIEQLIKNETSYFKSDTFLFEKQGASINIFVKG